MRLLWLVGFGLAVLCYWRHAGALNAFCLVPEKLWSIHKSSGLGEGFSAFGNFFETDAFMIAEN
jgi:hypothetical protein